MIRCLFISRVDGWAIIEEGEELFLFHPPYGVSHKKNITNSAAKAVVETGGFVESDLAFDDYKSAIDHLDDVVGRYRAEFLPVESAKALASRALKVASADQIIRLMAGIDAELTGSNDYDRLEEAIVEILGVEVSRKTPEIIDHGLTLLRKIGSMRESRNNVVSQSVDVGIIFPYCKKKYGSDALVAIGSMFRERRSMFAF